MRNLILIFLALFFVACSPKNKDERPIRKNQVEGCRGNYDCEPGRRCSGSRQELLAGMGICVDIYHDRRDIRGY